MKSNYNYQIDIKSIDVDINLLEKIEAYIDVKLIRILDENGRLHALMTELNGELKQKTDYLSELEEDKSTSEARLEELNKGDNSTNLIKEKSKFDIIHIRQDHTQFEIESLHKRIARNQPSLKFVVYDEFGSETIKSIKDYTDEFLPNDVRRVAIKYELLTSVDLVCDMALVFDKDKPYSNLSMNFWGENSKEIGQAATNGLMDVINNHSNNNYLYHPHSGISALLALYALFIGIIMIIDLPTGEIFQYNRLEATLLFVWFAVVVYLAVGKYIKHYSEFKTRRQEKLNKVYDKFLWMFITFIASAIFVTLFKNKIFGT